MLARFVLRPDRRMAVACLGLAVAVLLPVAVGLAIQAFDTQPSDDRWIAVATGPEGFDVPPGPHVLAAVIVVWQDGVWMAAHLDGTMGPGPGPGQVLPMPGAEVAAWPYPGDEMLAVAATAPELVPGGAFLVHPARLQGHAATAVLLDRAVPVPGATLSLARGADAFEHAGVEELRGVMGFVVLASVPAVVLVVAAFAGLETQRLLHTMAVMSAFGRPDHGRRLAAARVLLVVAVGTILATVAGYLLWSQAGSTFRPRDTNKTWVALSILVPAVAGAVTGVVAAWWGGRQPLRRLTTPGPPSEPSRYRLTWLPLGMRPLLLGTGVVPVLLVVALLFMAQVGFPVAAAKVPAAIAGHHGEWVETAPGGALLGSVPAGIADVLVGDDRIDAIVAETLVPTVVMGRPVLLRGGGWDGLAAYHGLDGTGPAPDGVLIGSKQATRLGLVVGDTVVVPASQRPFALLLRVEAIHTGTGLLADEGLLHADTARQLAGLPADQASVVRARPATSETLAVLEQRQPDIRVSQVHMDPADPEAGVLLNLHAELVNLGRQAGSRPITFHIDGVPVAQQTVAVPGHGRVTASAAIVAPDGPFRLEVNPSMDATARPSDVELAVPAIAFDDEGVAVRLLAAGAPQQGVTLELYRGLPGEAATRVAANSTDGDGRVLFAPVSAGRYHVVAPSLDQARVLVVGEAADRDQARLMVEGGGVTPDGPELGQSVRVALALRNMGGQEFTGTVDLFLDGRRLAQRDIVAAPGSLVPFEVTFPWLVARDGATLSVLDQAFVISAPVAATDPPVRQIGSGVRSGSEAQVEAADRLLGDAGRTLAALAGLTLLSVLSITYLATARTLQGRTQVAAVLEALGVEPDRVRRRAATEAAVLAGACFVVAWLPAKALFWGLRWLGEPAPFAHTLQDPLSPLFTLQALVAFCATAALAAYLATSRRVTV